MKPSAATVTVTRSSNDVAAGPFEEGRDAAAAQPAARLRLRAPRVEAVPVGEREPLVQDRLELAAVVGLRHRVLVGHLLGPDHVAPAQLGRVEPHLARRRVHQPLDQVDRLGPAGAAVGAGRRGVGQHRRAAAGRSSGCRRCWSMTHGPISSWIATPAAGRVGADVGERAHAQRQHAAVGVERELGLAATSRPCDARQELLAALGHPLAPAASSVARGVARRRRPPGRGRSSCRSRRRRRRRRRAPARADAEHGAGDAVAHRRSASGC